jgi:DNA-binding NarL/FixJ family response regulator
MIVDDQEMVRRGLALLVSGFDDMQLVAEAAGGAEAVEVCRAARPDVILMDLMMPEMNGVTAARAILEALPEVRIVALTSFISQELVRSAIEAGMIGYVLKDASVEELADAIRKAYRSKPAIMWEATRTLIGAAPAPPPDFTLTPREREVLDLIVRGLTNRQIAAELGVSRFTVNAHVSRILSKMRVSTRTEAAAAAIQMGLVS